MPYLAAAFLARAAWRFARGEFDAEGRGYGRGPWGGGHEHRPHGGREYGPPWGRGRDWGRGRGRWHEGDPRRETIRTLRADIGALIGVLRGTARRGGPTAQQVSEIRAVLDDARKRIAAILAENQRPGTIV